MKKDKTQNDFILIKKYSNRRLYNSSKSKYINFKELFELIKNNIDFKIKDYKTGKDLTQEILLQTIFEFKNTSKNVFTISFIKNLFLILNKNNSEEISIYLEECLKKYNDFKKAKKVNFEKVNILDLQLQILELKKQISKIN
tara:strand:- start:2091 stop:2516 length:426 start_codon:yes stop_codon:yes gene_type:complete